MRRIFAICSVILLNCSFASAVADMDKESINGIKNQIVALAESYEGKGDPDFSKQKELDIIISKLLVLAPQPPVKDRLQLLVGVWKQVWGPYDYRKDNRGVDPELGVKEIYQVVFKEGFYYNASPLFEDGKLEKEKIGLLRGEYQLDSKSPNILKVKFTKYPGVKPRPNNKNLWDLPSLAESGNLENEISIVPTFIVRLFFAKGALREVFTDHDLRILYGSDGKNFEKEYLYVMTRIPTPTVR